MKYYVRLANEDYLTEGGEPPGTWFGASAKALGLIGKVHPETFLNVMEGFSPGGSRPLVQNAGAEKRYRGIDLTFSPPKSLSTLWSQGDDMIRAEVEKAHRKAVEEALSYLEAVALWTRRGHGGMARERVGFCAAVFEHGTSRANDPQLHSHAVVASLCVREDGTTGSIRSWPIFAHTSAADAIYLSSLGHQLVKRLGLKLIDNDGRPFEVLGVPGSLMEEFSKRRRLISNWMAERSVSSGKAARVANLATRAAKIHSPRKDLLQNWRQTGRRYGWFLPQVHRLLNRREVPKGPIPTSDLRRTLRRLTTYNAHFGKRDVLRVVANVAQADGYPIPRIHEATERILSRMIPLGKVRGEMQFSTRSMLRIERWLLQRFSDSLHSTGHTMPHRLVNAAVQGIGLSQEQLKALSHVTETPGSIKMVDGLAGTGKSTLFKAAGQIWKKRGYNVLGIALTGKASQDLHRNTKMPTMTLASLLLQTNTPIISVGPVTLSGTSREIAWKAPKWNRLAHLRIPSLTFGLSPLWGPKITSKTVIVLDEAGLVGTRQLAQLVKRVTHARAKLVMVGDSRQLGPIEAGNPFRSLVRTFGGATLTDIQRQRHPWARRVVRDFADGKTADALDELNARGAIRVADSKTAATSRLVEDWWRTGSRETSLILGATREQVARLNQAAQAKVLANGGLSGAGIEHNGQRFYMGDQVVFDRNDRRLGVSNGTFGKIELASQFDFGVRLDSGSRIKVPLYDYKDISLGYAITTHRSQGTTCENVFSLLSNEMLSSKQLYVQASRAREGANFYLEQGLAGENLKDLKSSISSARPTFMATEILERQARLAVERQGCVPGLEQSSESRQSWSAEARQKEEQEETKKKTAREEENRKRQEESSRREKESKRQQEQVVRQRQAQEAKQAEERRAQSQTRSK